VFNPLFHVSPMRSELVTSLLSASPTGDEGTKTITAPLPGEDASDSPYELVTVTIATTLSPWTKLYGDA